MDSEPQPRGCPGLLSLRSEQDAQAWVCYSFMVDVRYPHTCSSALHGRRPDSCFLSLCLFHTHIPKYFPVLMCLAEKACGERHQTGNEAPVKGTVYKSCFLMAFSGIVHLLRLAW